MPKFEYTKTFVRPDNTAVLTCPHCNMQKTIMTDPFRGDKHKLKVKCLCTKAFMMFLEFRKRVRKRTSLRGSYINHSQNDSSGKFVIQDISVIGLTLFSLDAPTFKMGDELSVKFNLYDEHQTEIRKEVIVRNVGTTSVGGEFVISGDKAFDGPLGQYIMS